MIHSQQYTSDHIDQLLCDHAYRLESDSISSLSNQAHLPVYCENVISYIAGFVLEKMSPSISCAVCKAAVNAETSESSP